MNDDFWDTWLLVRDRFDAAVTDLGPEALNYRPYPGVLTIGEMVVHVAGVEVWFTAQLFQESLEGFAASIAKAATDGVVNDRPFPLSRVGPEDVRESLALGRGWAERLFAAGDDVRSRSLKSALGPIIDGAGAMARLAYHPGYHQGQVHMIRSAPGFPEG